MRKHSWLATLPFWYFLLLTPLHGKIVFKPSPDSRAQIRYGADSKQYGPYASEELCNSWSYFVTTESNGGDLLNGPSVRTDCWSDDPNDDSPPPVLEDFTPPIS